MNHADSPTYPFYLSVRWVLQFLINGRRRTEWVCVRDEHLRNLLSQDGWLCTLNLNGTKSLLFSPTDLCSVSVRHNTGASGFHCEAARISLRYTGPWSALKQDIESPYRTHCGFSVPWPKPGAAMWKETRERGMYGAIPLSIIIYFFFRPALFIHIGPYILKPPSKFKEVGSFDACMIKAGASKGAKFASEKMHMWQSIIYTCIQKRIALSGQR